MHLLHMSNVAINSVQFIIPKNQGFKCDNLTYFTHFTNVLLFLKKPKSVLLNSKTSPEHESL